MSKSRSASDERGRKADKDAAKKDPPRPADGGWRETVESIAMAVILALLFRGFVAEAFVIPTGSMAPTLRGRHKDVQCPECGKWFQTGSSQEVGGTEEANEAGLQTKDVVAGVCPTCRFTRPINRFENPDDDSFSGDRIIVNKFLYDFSAPRRWDVIVFKWPGNGTLNYIKRLIGLPNETVRIQGGNIWVRQGKEGPFQIARKPPDKLNMLLQPVSDSEHASRRKLDAQWPLDWIEGTPIAPPAAVRWKHERMGPHSVAFLTDGTGEGDSWLRYRHLLATSEEWQSLLKEPPSLPPNISGLEGELITDFCAYNAYDLRDGKGGGILEPEGKEPRAAGYHLIPVTPVPGRGQHWVDDLAVECLADVQSDTGELLLDLVRAGVHYTCRIDVGSGKATLTRVDMDGSALEFEADGNRAASLQARTAVRGKGAYRVRMANCDHEVTLWVNGSVVKFDHPATYDNEESQALAVPRSTSLDYGDLLPVGIGSKGAAMRLSQLRVFRDVYYVAQKNDAQREWFLPTSDEEFFQSPELWTEEVFVRGRNVVDFELGPDQFFPLGDNSPASQDARTWPLGNVKMPTPNYVRRDLLIGKAIFVYWPHTWNRPVPFWPNPTQMRPIR